MPLSAPELFAQLDRVSIGPVGATLDLTTRLARENGWSLAFAARVIGEYRRYLYLTQLSVRPVTPSDEVDQAWHLHLNYTRSYWDGLCGEILGRPLHHEPTRGGPDERRRFHRQYRATLDLYEREFDRPPPADIWPDAGRRFAGRQVRIDRDTVWTIEKAAVRRFAGLTLGGGALALALAACADLASGLGSLGFAEKLGLTVILILVAWSVIRRHLIRAEARRRDRREHGGGSGGCGASGCSDGGDSGCGGGGCN